MANGALGANFNENFEDYNPRELDAAGSRWVRMFVALPQIDKLGSETGAIPTILNADAAGYGTILSVKFRYMRTALPTQGNTEWARAEKRLDTVLAATMGKIDMLVIGNEPFIETREEDRGAALNAFYEAMARRAIDYRATHCSSPCRTQIFMGSLTRLDLPKNRTETTARWLEFVRETPEIAGVDIHPHLPAIEASQQFLDYVLPRMRPDQKFLVTEFSLVWHWQSHMKDSVSEPFAKANNMKRNVQVWQVIDASLKTPFPQPLWDSFLSNEPWFESRKGYLRNQMAMFRKTGKLAVATYGFRQDSSMTKGGFTAERTPWLLNSVWAPATVAPAANGLPGRNPYWFKQFKALQDYSPPTN
ncbi:hypothetical protein A6F68_00800 [Tsuneonella dongtanensis]|uniref:Asl1-like glycosyl hydrolase catalytic domain-containing protein n=1 Tax=Tsuneonella dongtanensis TaxID=692370 RepID=A0A1B2AB07_9SPHN|nr:hypothetical protein [Tsuneonella dongtanensis]ANY19326.1 hypothetical protein A6F68_00800 [Tsuneonella dongtanensis]